jgi:hypothetical protein
MMHRMIHTIIALIFMVTLVGCASPRPSFRRESRTYVVRLELDSAQMGSRTLSIDVRDRAGERTMLQRVTVAPSLPTARVILPEIEAIPAAGGAYEVAGLSLGQAGVWTFDIRVAG